MSTALPAQITQLHTQITADGRLRLGLARVPMPVPAAHEVLIQVEAAPINPSDMGLLFGAADMATLAASLQDGQPVLTGQVPPGAMPAMAGRIGQSMPAGNEGAGLVVAAGDSPEAQALLGQRVAALGGGMYATHRALPAAQCLRLPAGATAAQGASCFVNPLTALGMVETMRREGHKALVHTAAASNLGQMLLKICQKDGIGLVNIVRSPSQVALMRGLGATQVVDMSAPDFMAQLTDAVGATGATLGFDATGGGRLGGQILQAMEAALQRQATEYNRYGTATHKQVYLYGNLQAGPTEFTRSFGMSWGMGGWLLFPFLQKAGPQVAQQLKQRVADELHTTFASHYAGELSLADMLKPEAVARYGVRATGSKYLVLPQRG